MAQQRKTQTVGVDVSSTTTGPVASGGAQCLSVGEGIGPDGLGERSVAGTGVEAQKEFVQQGQPMICDALSLLVIDRKSTRLNSSHDI